MLTIAIASGKGGTGKTTIAVSLALTLAERYGPVSYLDCDVEEPNGHLFLKPVIETTAPVTMPVPKVNLDACTRCGECSNVCQHHAIVMLGPTVLTFPELCAGCGGCALACPEKAVTEDFRTIGTVEEGWAGTIHYVGGRLNVGEVRSARVVAAVKRRAPRDGIVIIDAPPGTTCPVVEAVKGSHVTVLVSEPTPFGLHDLALAARMIAELKIPMVAALNREGIGNGRVADYCKEKGIPVVLALAEDLALARACARGEPAVEAFPDLKATFLSAYDALTRGIRP